MSDSLEAPEYYPIRESSPLINVIRSASKAVDDFRPGSIRASVFTLVLSTVGAGILTLPYAMAQSGMVLGGVFMILGAMCCGYSLYVLTLSSTVTRKLSYGNLALTLYGNRFATFVQAVILINQFGNLVAYLVAIRTLVPQAVHMLVDKRVELIDSAPLFLGILLCGLVLPLGLQRNLSGLRFASLFSFAWIVYLTVVVVFEFYHFSFKGAVQPFFYRLFSREILLGNLSPLSMFKTFPVIIFAFTCHAQVLPLYTELQRPSMERINRVVKYALSLSCSMYLLVSMYGFMTFGRLISGNVLLEDYHKAVEVVVSILGLSFSVLMSCPIFCVSSREIILSLVYPGVPEGHHSLIPHSIVTVLFAGGAYGIAVAVSDISQVISILGATTNPFICFLLPALYLHRADVDGEFSTPRKVSYGLAAVMTLISVGSLVIQLVAYAS